MLMYYGKKILEDFEKKGWSKRFIKFIEGFNFTTNAGADYLKINIERFHMNHMVEEKNITNNNFLNFICLNKPESKNRIISIVRQISRNGGI
jgi:hypothetical protein